ncbi:MAG: cell surface protein [Myxococcota bacterium]
MKNASFAPAAGTVRTRRPVSLPLASLLLVLGCAGDDDASFADGGFLDGSMDGGTTTDGAAPDAGPDAGDEDAGSPGNCGNLRPDVFADEVVSFMPGPNAGFGQDDLPCVVLGPPVGEGDGAGSLDVLSLGNAGEIVLAFRDTELVDGPGPDLLVFENPFSGFTETGAVAVSEDGITWEEWPCLNSASMDFPGCAGVRPVFANPDNDIDPTDPEAAGGDAFDLADLGLTRARFVRIRDTGWNVYGGMSGGFDLDAIAAVNRVDSPAP